MLDTLWTSNVTIELFTDSAGGRNKGFWYLFSGEVGSKLLVKKLGCKQDNVK